MDAVMSHQAGVTNTVAVSGTALTQEQLKTIRRLSDTIISSFDSDAAGEAATKRSLDLAAEFDFERKAALLPAGIKDPADAVASNPEIWQKAILGSVQITELLFKQATAKFNPESANGAKTITAAVLPEINHLANEVEKAHWVRKLAGAINVSEESVWNELAKLSRAKAYTQKIEEADEIYAKSRREQLEELTLGLIGLYGKNPKAELALSDDMFLKEVHRDIFNEIGQLGSQKAALLSVHKDHLNNLAFRAEVFLGASPDKEAEINSIIREFRIEHLKHRRDSMSRKITEAEKTKNETELTALLRDYKGVCDEIIKASQLS